MAQTEADLLETCVSSQTLAEGGMLVVKRDQVQLANGSFSQREYVMHPGAVVIVPVLPNGNILFERQYRYPLHRVFIELPAGKIDAGEAPLLTGQRELQEETGYIADEWVYLGCQHPCIGYSDEIIHIYLAREMRLGDAQPDDDEALLLMQISPEESMDMIMQDAITDSKTITALFKAARYLQYL